MEKQKSKFITSFTAHKYFSLSLILFILLAAGVLGFWGSVNAAESPICEARAGYHCYYVAPWGDDSNDGSFEKPFKTIQKGVDSMQPGDYLYLRNGTYHEIGIHLGMNFWYGREDAWYTIKSYPGEWAIVDGQHNISNNVVQEEVNSWADELNVFRGTTQAGRIGYVKFESMEITGGGLDINDPQYPVSGAAINMHGGPFVFRRLYIHDNYGKDNNNAAGLRLSGVCNSVIEHCHFKSNSQIKEDPAEPGVRTTSIANVLIFADYAYSKPVTLYRQDTGYCSATFGNEIKYNLFEADSNRGSEYFTNVGFKQKGMQRLTGYVYADQENPQDELPNDDSLKALGDKIHHNIFINHTVGIEVDQDYTQVYNNIIIMKKRNGPNNAIQGRDENSDRRGPFGFVVYNNLIKGNGMKGIRHHPVPDGWTGDVPYIKAYIYNNILDNASGDYDSEDISIESDSVSASGGYPMENISLDRNYFYNPPDSEIFYIYHTKYNKTEIESTPSADMVFVSQENSENPLYNLAQKYEIKVRAEHNLGNGMSISNAGIGIPHPYLEGISIPSYIGPCPDSECSWVDDVLTLSDISSLIEGNMQQTHCGNSICETGESCPECPECCSQDITPPILSSGNPSGTLPSSTTQTTISLTTNEPATCKYSTTPNTPYSSMPNTFSSTGGTSHSTTVSGLGSGNSYSYYIRCQDASGNANNSDYAISFSIASCIPDWSCTDWTDCSNGIQTRTCTDSNSCGTTAGKPSESQTCSVPPPSPFCGDGTCNGAETCSSCPADCGSCSSGGGGYIIDTTPPGYPNNFIATPGNKQITLKWDNPTDPDFNKVKLLRKEGGYPSSHNDPLAKTIYQGKEEQYTDTGLDNSKTYYYAIYAFDSRYNCSNPSTVSSKPVQEEQQGTNQEQEQASTSTTTTTPTTPTATTTPIQTIPITHSLYYGMRSKEVKALQELLSKDKDIYPQGITSGFYGKLTQQAVQRFQCKYRIVCYGTPYTTGYGAVGPKTREKLRQVYGSGLAANAQETNKQPLSNQSLEKQEAIQQLKEKIKQLQQQIIQLMSQLVELLNQEIKSMPRKGASG